ncbi:MAG: Xaa-Pro dipeptidyl-peptidase [Bacteroidales bacterium]|nr:Xaa-Pro dipeptidyl-peptidase [Bacteroidales bacterium]
MKNLLRYLFASAIILTTLLASGQTPGKIKVPLIADGQAQIIPEFSDPDTWIRHDLWVETEFDSDGDGKADRVHVGVTRPQQTDTEGLKLPVIYATSPYYAGTASGRKWLWDVRQELNTEAPERIHAPRPEPRVNRPVISNSELKEWVPRGFIVVHSSSPGTGLSEGCPTVGGDNESLAPKAVIDWLNGRAKGYTGPDSDEEVRAYWTTGKVGMTGTSYNGTLPLAAATTGVDGLEVIIPIAPNTSYYHYYRSYGLVRHPGGWLGEDIDYLYDFIHTGSSDRWEWCNDKVRNEEMYGNFDRVYGDYNEFWAGRDYLNDLEPLKCAVLMAHAFNDWNVVPIHSWRISKALKEKGIPVQMYYHQGGHGGQPPFEMMNKWFTHYLFGVENNIHDGPKAWIVRENDERENPTPYADYPNPEAENIVFYPSPGAPERGTLELERIESAGRETLVDNVSFSGEALARAEWTEHRLIYLTPELKKDIHISGLPSITIKAASSKPAVNLSVWLVSLPWTEGRNTKITDNVITRGWADLQNYKSEWESEALIPGRFYEMTFDLQPDDQIIPAGQQIGLMIFSSDRDFTLWPEPGTELTIDLDGTSLSLPVVGGRKAYEEALK